MYVCTNYLKDDKKLRIQVGRPNYNSRNLEAATIILSVSIVIDELNHEGPPMYYAIASGQNQVLIRSIYMTNLDRVTCTGEYERVDTSESAAVYQSCDLTCHEECQSGCNKRDTPTACIACKHDTFYFTESRFECIPSCGALQEVILDNNGRSVKTGSIMHTELINGISTETEKKAFMDGTNICRLCHAECAFGCSGITNKDCISENVQSEPFNKGCNTVQYDREFGRCLTKCPKSYYIDNTVTIDSVSIPSCVKCNDACQECIDTEFVAPATLDGYLQCCGSLCSNGYFKVDNGLEKIMCVKSCPDGYYKTEDKRCLAKWTVIGYQNSAFNNTEYLSSSLDHADGVTTLSTAAEKKTILDLAKQEPMTNFFDVNELDAAGSFVKDGKWKLRFDWQLENEVLGQLVWTQSFAPKQADNTLVVDVSGCDITCYADATGCPNCDIEILSFTLNTCNEQSADGEEKLDISLTNEWSHCASGVTDVNVIPATGLSDILTVFKGVVVNEDFDETDRAVFPIVEVFSTADAETQFFSFGQDWMHRGYLFPAFFVPATAEQEYALRVRLSVFDERTNRELTQWTTWTDCNDCGRDQPKYRSRTSECPGSESTCFPSVEVLSEEGVCDTTACPFGDYSDNGACSYHSACCQTIKVQADKPAVVDGHYSKLYIGIEPYVIYKKVGAAYYLHHSSTHNLWVISNGYWLEGLSSYVIYYKSTSADTDKECPSDVTKWLLVSDGSLADLRAVCDDRAGQRCPGSHPYAYDDGAHCCALPFEDVDDVYGINCDASPISLESKCCLNAADQPDLTTSCKALRCLNYQYSEANTTEFNFPNLSNGFFRYQHRGCTGADIVDCGLYKDISTYETCPSWLIWGAWSDCTKYEQVLTPHANDNETSFYEKFRRDRSRECNTHNITQCLTEPGLDLITEEIMSCGNIFNA